LTECSSHHQGESAKVQTNAAIYSHALLSIHVIGGQRSVRIPIPPYPPPDPLGGNHSPGSRQRISGWWRVP